ncbi:ImmA/IrrE family metallo-endopeptidase [Halobacillus sp. BBL2006]|uniref:ImmA/IrrE family metallo-endopeptidase n=1 Tax=Halobacillus sp. BBL2006 TaxID=1543706 RepID=UPI00267F0FF0
MFVRKVISLRFPYYTTTILEDLITQWYKSHKFTEPDDLNVYTIGSESQIFVTCRPTQASYMRVGKFQEIVLDSRLPYIHQREQFFHELCHALRHAGRQSFMPYSFYELQERDARHFTLYASLPTHMINDYNLSNPAIIDQLSHDFMIPRKVCIERLEKIKSRIVPSDKSNLINLRKEG